MGQPLVGKVPLCRVHDPNPWSVVIPWAWCMLIA
jgi:hypothetical protein